MILLIAALAAISSLQPNAAKAQALVKAVESKYAGARTLEAAFFETYRAGSGGGQAESGTVYFSKPGRMRWEYESPEPKLFIVDGKNVWFYVPADHTASRASLKTSEDWRTPLALLTGKIHLNRLCAQIELLDKANGGSGFGDLPNDPRNRILRCFPHKPSEPDEQAAFREILFEVTPNAELVRVVIREPGEVQTEFRFGNWKENVELAESKFHFEPPPGVAIVNEEDLARRVQ